MQNELSELDLKPEPLELDMQELEPMDAPGFWTGVGIGATLSSATVAAAAYT
jgi:hypothetical protein